MDDLAQRIIYKWQAGGKKPMLVGKPGCGKTAFVNYLAEKMGAELLVINMSTFEASDMNGIPYLDQETHKVKWSLPFWAQQVIENYKDGKKTIVFLDETNLANSEVRNGAQTTIQSGRTSSGEQLPEIYWIGAMNTSEDLESVADFSNAMKDRWAFIPFDFPVEEWHKLYKDNFGKPQTPREKKIREKLSAFLTINPHLLEGRKPLKASAYGITDEVHATTIENSTPNRRNWDNLAREMAQTKDEEELKHFLKPMMVEIVGLECYRNYKEYISTENKPLNKYKWDGEPDEISQQINRLRAEENVDKQVAYFVRAHEYCKNKEVIASVATDVITNAIHKYSGEYKEKFPEFYNIMKEMRLA